MNDLKRTFAGLTKNVAKTSNNLIKATKLNISLANEEENLKSLYMEIGRKVHEIYSYGGSLGKFFDEKYEEVQQIERSINELRDQIGEVKGETECRKCGRRIDSKVEFCPKCGSSIYESKAAPISEPEIESEMKIEIAPGIQTPEPEIIENRAVDKKCPSCSASNDAQERFCLSCGRII